MTDHDDDEVDGKTAAFEEYAAELVAQLQAARAVTDLDECHSLWKQLTIEARSLEPKQTYLDRCQVYKSQIQAKKLALERSDLLSSATATSSPSKDVESKLARQNVVLDESLKRIHETEDLAGEIANNLHTNRATIQNVKQNTATLTSLTDQANQLADRLLRPWWKKAL
jgi:hypothetical protein